MSGNIVTDLVAAGALVLSYVNLCRLRRAERAIKELEGHCAPLRKFVSTPFKLGGSSSRFFTDRLRSAVEEMPDTSAGSPPREGGR